VDCRKPGTAKVAATGEGDAGHAPSGEEREMTIETSFDREWVLPKTCSAREPGGVIRTLGGEDR
jgi:hypothetical protein